MMKPEISICGQCGKLAKSNMASLACLDCGEYWKNRKKPVPKET